MAVFHVAAGAVELLVEPARLRLLRAERGDDKARIGRTARPFGLGDHAAVTAPAVARRPGKLLKSAAPAGRWLCSPPRPRRARRRSRRRDARSWPGQTNNRPGWPRTSSSTRRGQPPNRRAAQCAPRASARGSARRCVRLPRPLRRRRQCWRAAVLPPADAGRRRCTAADNSSSPQGPASPARGQAP